MRRLHLRSPSPALIVAMLALFLAAGGAGAVSEAVSAVKAKLSGSQIKKSSIPANRLTADARKSLRGKAGAPGATGAAGKAGPVGPAGPTVFPGAAAGSDLGGTYPNLQLKPNAVTAAEVADGGLGVRDIARYANPFRVTVAALGSSSNCSAGTTSELTAVGPGQDLRDDVIVVTPPPGLGDVTVTARADGQETIRVVVCAPTGVTAPVGELGPFRLATVDAPGNVPGE